MTVSTSEKVLLTILTLLQFAAVFIVALGVAVSTYIISTVGIYNRFRGRYCKKVSSHEHTPQQRRH